MLFLVLGIAVSGCGRQSPQAATTDNSAPRLSISTGRVDFGNLISGAKPSQVVRLTNDGDSMLQIFGIETSCGCTVAKLDAEVVRPGESSELRITLDTARRSTTAYEGYVNIKSNDPGQRIARIVVVGQVNPRIRITPGHLVFDEMWEGEVRNTSFTVESTKQEEIWLEAKVPKESGFGVTLDPTHILPSNGPVRVTATVTAGQPGNYSGKISLLTSQEGEELDENATVTLGIHVNEAIVVSPKQLYFVERAQGATVKRLSIRPANPQAGSVHVRRTRFDANYLDVQIEETTDHESTLIVTLKPFDKKTQRSPKVDIVIEAESEAGVVELRVPVRFLTRVGSAID